MKIYVGNLDSETTASDVSDAFAKHGEVHDKALTTKQKR